MHHNLACGLGLLTVCLLLDSAAGSSSPQSSYEDYHYNNASQRLLRFHDFEPRVKPEKSRESRGFHFNAAGDDVSVEMEFIVPFVKVPVRRSVKLARDALQGLLNLRTGALLNTAVVVAAGAIIAAIVRLVLAPIIYTAQGYGYGYGKQEQPQTANSLSRGMRSLRQVLDEQSIDVSVCAQRAICHYLQHNAAQLHLHQPHQTVAPSAARLIDVLANSRWLDYHLNGTAVFEAVDVARSSRSCSQIYRSCSWPQNRSWRSWPSFLQYFNGYISA